MPAVYFPICINLQRHKILIVGGGKVCQQKLKSLLKFDSKVTVVAKEALDSIKTLAKNKKISLVSREFSDADIKYFDVIYACTNDVVLNKRIARLAGKSSKLFNIAGQSSLSSFISPAIYKKGNLLIGVSTSAKDPKLSVRIRDNIKKLF